MILTYTYSICKLFNCFFDNYFQFFKIYYLRGIRMGEVTAHSGYIIKS